MSAREGRKVKQVGNNKHTNQNYVQTAAPLPPNSKHKRALPKQAPHLLIPKILTVCIWGILAMSTASSETKLRSKGCSLKSEEFVAMMKLRRKGGACYVSADANEEER